MGKRTFEQAFMSAEQRNHKHFQVVNMEAEDARLCETQLQKKAYNDKSHYG